MAEIIDTGHALDRAVALLSAGGLVAIPTETVYGLAADATNGEAVARIFEAKGRPRFNPLIGHVASIEMAADIGVMDAVSERLAKAFWPGPLTIILPLRQPSIVHPLVTAGLDTIALRMPRGFGGTLIKALGRPLAAPSANSSGLISATSAGAVAEDLGGKIALIVDAGPTPVGVESTIVRVSGDRILLLRPGGLAADEMERLTGLPVVRGHDGKIVAPGMLASHYAPAAPVRVNASEVLAGEALLAFGPRRIRGAESVVAMRNLSEAGDLIEAARNLFAYLKELDRSGAHMIAVEPVPTDRLGEAINDRLLRAAAPRDMPLART